KSSPGSKVDGKHDGMRISPLNYAANVKDPLQRTFIGWIGCSCLARVQRLPGIHVEWTARADSQRSGPALVDRLLPDRDGAFGRSVPRHPGHHQFSRLRIAPNRNAHPKGIPSIWKTNSCRILSAEL